MFVMDSSGSVGWDGWQVITNFVEQMVIFGVDSLSDISIIKFSYGAWAEWNFTDSQNRTEISNHVSSTSWTTGQTYTRTAITTTILITRKSNSTRCSFEVL